MYLCQRQVRSTLHADRYQEAAISLRETAGQVSLSRKA
jgi:hypothetical protein